MLGRHDYFPVQVITTPIYLDAPWDGNIHLHFPLFQGQVTVVLHYRTSYKGIIFHQIPPFVPWETSAPLDPKIKNLDAETLEEFTPDAAVWNFAPLFPGPPYASQDEVESKSWCVFVQPSKNGGFRGHVFWPNPKKHVSTDSSWFELKLLKYHCSVALSMFCQVFVEMNRPFLQDDFGSTN